MAYLSESVMVLYNTAAGEREGRPKSEILKAGDGYILLRTDRNGWIELTSDGEQIWVEVEK